MTVMNEFVRDMLARAERDELHIVPEDQREVWWARDPETGRFVMGFLDKFGRPKFNWGREARIKEVLRSPLSFDDLAALVGEVRAAYEMMTRAQDELTLALNQYQTACERFMEVTRQTTEGARE